ncbi:WD40-repeat-containing domain protein [Dichomitus squalens]|nr:WD40-repeat-containing domain protein [Dichomitus squalens]
MSSNTKPTLLPVDVIEDIIDMSSNDLWTLCNFSLSCRALLDRSRRHIFVHIYIRRKDQLENLSEFLDARPWLPPLIKQVTISPGDYPELLGVVPLPLFTRLPNLHYWGLKDTYSEDRFTLVMHRSALLGLRAHGTHINCLTISGVFFPSCADLGRFLLAFPRVQDLTCISCSGGGKSSAADTVIRQRLAETVHYKRLTIRGVTDRRAATFLTEISQNAVEHLAWYVDLSYDDWKDNTAGPLHLPRQFPFLKTLVVDITLCRWQQSQGYGRGLLTRIIEILAHIRLLDPAPCKGPTVTIRIQSDWLHKLYYFLTLDITTEVCQELERVMLSIPSPCIVMVRAGATAYTRGSYRRRFWTSRIDQMFAGLLRAKRFKAFLNPIDRSDSHTVAHEEAVSVLVAFTNGEWFASGSLDSTIIVWDAESHTAVWDWVAHERCVDDLAFAPDGRYLLSVGGDTTPKVWDLASDAVLAATLDGHTARVRSCAWCSTGEWLATGSDDGSVRVWSGPGNGGDAFQQCYQLADPQCGAVGIVRVLFSPDARWVLALHTPWKESRNGHHLCLWDVGRKSDPGPLQKVLGGHPGALLDAAFDPASRRIVAGCFSWDQASVFIWDVETGETRSTLPTKKPTEEVMFSSDGKTVCTLATSDGKVNCWDAERCTVTLSLEGPGSDYCLCPRLSPDGRYIATGSNGSCGVVTLWRTSDGSCAAVLRGASEERSYRRSALDHLVFSGGGHSLAYGGELGRIFIHAIDDILSM